MTRQERTAAAISKKLVAVLIQIEQFDADPELVLDSAKVDLHGYKRRKVVGTDGTEGALEALAHYYSGEED